MRKILGLSLCLGLGACATTGPLPTAESSVTNQYCVSVGSQLLFGNVSECTTITNVKKKEEKK